MDYLLQAVPHSYTMIPLGCTLGMEPYNLTPRPPCLRDSPFGKLPNELIVEKFLISTLIDYPPGIASLDAFATQLPKPKLDKDRAPLKLCHLCYLLCCLVLNCPLLWARFGLEASTSPAKEAQSEL